MVNEEALNFMPSRHYAAYIIGLFPSIYDWAVNVSDKSPIQSQDTGGNINLTPFSQWFGVLAWKRGALLVSFVWVSMLVMVIDRQWKKAAIWALIGAGFAMFGIIHVPEAGFESFSDPVWEQCVAYPGDCWEYAEQWMFMTSYLMLAATFGAIDVFRSSGLDKSLLPPIEDDTSAAFNDWFADAGTVHAMHTHKPGEEDIEIPVDESKRTVKTMSDTPENEEEPTK
jgi:hypothetical protein